MAYQLFVTNKAPVHTEAHALLHERTCSSFRCVVIQEDRLRDLPVMWILIPTQQDEDNMLTHPGVIGCTLSGPGRGNIARPYHLNYGLITHISSFLAWSSSINAGNVTSLIRYAKIEFLPYLRLLQHPNETVYSPNNETI